MADPTLFDVYDYSPDPLRETFATLRRPVVPLSQRGTLASGTEVPYRQDNPDDYIRRLIIETNANVRPEDVPLHEEDRLLGIRPKLPNRQLMDRRREYFLDNMLDTYGRPSVTVGEPDPVAGASSGREYGDRPEKWNRLPKEVADAMWAYSTGDHENVAGNYENTGVLGPGAPLSTVSKWMMGLPQALYGTSDLLANAVGGRARTNAQAVQDIERGGGAIIGAGPFEDMARYRKQADMNAAFDRDRQWYQNLYPRDDQAVETMVGSMDGGEELLERYKVDELIGRLGTRALGGVMDATLNPFFGGPDIQAAAKAGKATKALGLTALEYLPDASIAAGRTYLENRQ